MATRFYLPSSGAANISPAYSADWEDTSIATRLRMHTTKLSTAMTTVSFADADDTSRDILFHQYVSDPITAVTITNPTINFQIRAAGGASGNNLFTSLHLRIIQPDGSLRGNILSVTRDNTEVNLTDLQNRQHSSAPTVTVATQDGDRLVVEIGLGGNPNAGDSHSGSIRTGDAAASDLPEDDSSELDRNPWIEISTTIYFILLYGWFVTPPPLPNLAPQVTGY